MASIIICIIYVYSVKNVLVHMHIISKLSHKFSFQDDYTLLHKLFQQYETHFSTYVN